MAYVGLHCSLAHAAPQVMSSCLCKGPEGAAAPPVVEAVEDGVDDSFHAVDVHKTSYRPSAAPDLHEPALDGIGGAWLAPQVPIPQPRRFFHLKLLQRPPRLAVKIPQNASFRSAIKC